MKSYFSSGKLKSDADILKSLKKLSAALKKLNQDPQSEETKDNILLIKVKMKELIQLSKTPMWLR